MGDSFRIVVVGATQSTLRIVQGLVRNGANLVGVFSLDPSVGAKVSGFATPEIESFCQGAGIPFQLFVHVNDVVTTKAVRALAPDVLFAVGFSQLVGDEVLSFPSKGAVGFHPTCLPVGRGRAPLAWLTHDIADGCSTFFVMGKGVDDGPILVQEPFMVSPDDHAGDVETAILDAIDRALDRWVPSLVQGEWFATPQDDSLANYTGIRRPSDGLIDWEEPMLATYARIRAASRPHPGAYTYADNRKILIWRAEPATDMAWRGVPGRVLFVCVDRGTLVQVGEGQLWLREIEDVECPGIPVTLRVGQKLGYVSQDEIFKLKSEIESLKQQVAALKNFPK